MIGTYHTEDLMQKWFIETLPAARRILENFESLNTLFGGFSNYETKKYRDVRNIVMLFCLPKVEGGINPKSVERLTTLERSIDFFGIMNWASSRLNSFKSRLASDDYIQSLSATTELDVAYHLAQKPDVMNIELYPPLEGGGLSDISVNIDNKSIFLEVGNLGESLPEKKIQQILDESAKHLGEKVDERCYFRIHVDTAELAFDEKGRIHVGLSTKKLNSEIDMLVIHRLVGFKGYFNLDDIARTIANQTLYEKMDKWLDPMTRELLDLIHSKEVERWLGSFDSELLKEANLIKSIITSPGTSTLLVEIHPLHFFPSKASIAERESFLNHLLRNVETQIQEKQIQPNAPNIILVQGFHWTVFGMRDFSDLLEQVQQFLDERRYRHLSGIAVFGADLDNILFMSNDHAGDSSRLSEADIDTLGFKRVKLT